MAWRAGGNTEESNGKGKKNEALTTEKTWKDFGARVFNA
jgi:hypothetical protein